MLCLKSSPDIDLHIFINPVILKPKWCVNKFIWLGAAAESACRHSYILYVLDSFLLHDFVL